MDLSGLAEAFSEVLNNKAVRVIIITGVILLVQAVAYMVIDRIVRRSVRSNKYEHKVDEEKREQTLINIFHTAATVAIWIIGVIIILSEIGVNLAALATGAGVVGVIIGIGAQSFIKDLLAGVSIIIENQYRVGDIVTIDTGGTQTSGLVEEITIRITRLRDLDGNLHIIQNGAAIIVTNQSFDYANVNIDVSVSYDSDVDMVERVINEVGEKMIKDETWQEHLIEPVKFLRVDNFGESGIIIKALGKVRPGMQWDVAGEFRRQLLSAFEKNGVTIPLPQVVVHETKETRKKR